MYGIPAVVPIDETQPKEPINPYGASKLMIERMLADYDMAYGLRSASLRYFNAAGADPERRIGEQRAVEAHLIPLAFDAILGVRPPLPILGTDYPTPDGTAIRDYVHVRDLAGRMSPPPAPARRIAELYGRPWRRPGQFGHGGAARLRARDRPQGTA